MFLAILAAVAAAILPTSPGAVNPAVTQANIHSTICVSGWTKTVRPPTSYTNKLKSQQMAALGYTGDVHLYEEDHRVPIEVGGNPTDPANLWPELWDGPLGAHRKDVLETKIKRLVCSGKMSLSMGQAIFLGDWTEGYRMYVGLLPTDVKPH